jgi:hypothetical protein
MKSSRADAGGIEIEGRKLISAGTVRNTSLGD